MKFRFLRRFKQGFAWADSPLGRSPGRSAVSPRIFPGSHSSHAQTGRSLPVAIAWAAIRHWLSLGQGASLGLGLSLLCLGLWQGGLDNLIEPPAQGLLFQSRGAEPWDERLVLIEIDDRSLAQLGTLPWSRDRYTELLQILTTSAPNLAVFDLLFTDVSSADPAFAAAMQRHGYVVLGDAWGPEGNRYPPQPRLAAEAIALGHMNYFQSRRDRYPEVPAALQDAPALSVAALQAYAVSWEAVPLLPPAATLWVNWPGSWANLRRYSFVDVLQHRVDPAVFNDKIIMIGATATGSDPFALPFTVSKTESLSGVHLHLALLHNLLQQNMLRIPRKRWIWPLLFCGGGLLVGHWGDRRGTRQQLIGFGVFCGGWLGFCWLALKAHWLVPITPPLLGLGVIALGLMTLDKIRLARLTEQLQEEISLDGLTQIKNRRFFNESLARLERQRLRDPDEISLILCDIDYFKRYNDTYGHPAGDRCLAVVAQTMQAVLQRPEDFVARYGGEEFVVVLPKTPSAGAIYLAEQIQQRISVLALPHQASPFQQVTLSLGIATLSVTSGESLSQLVQRADEALYQAKQRGRDRYCLAPPEVCH